MLEGSHFIVLAGLPLVEQMRAETRARCTHTGSGYNSDQLCALQRERASRQIIGVEIVKSNYGHSVRYDSGLQDFGLLAGKRIGNVDGSYESAHRFALAWVAKDPARRYAWERAR
jgi:hypothetical protein